MLGKLEVTLMSIRWNYIQLLVGMLFVLSITASSVLASDPLEHDKYFLFGDPDGDDISTWEELIIGADPYNADSDNDGLPDFWEYYIAVMDPTDASDAHLDYDYYPVNEFSLGEQDSEFGFRAIKRSIDVWPANKEMTYTETFFLEDGIHYDNYEEYYRSYIDTKDGNKQKLMSTDPRDSDSDDDGTLDPDDFYPLDYLFQSDGVCMDPQDDNNNENEPIITTNPDNSQTNDQLNQLILFDPISEYNPELFDFQTNRNILLEEARLKHEAADIYLKDIDNDGF